jgi:hypothetical protein
MRYGTEARNTVGKYGWFMLTNYAGKTTAEHNAFTAATDGVMLV